MVTFDVNSGFGLASFRSTPNYSKLSHLVSLQTIVCLCVCWFLYCEHSFLDFLGRSLISRMERHEKLRWSSRPRSKLSCLVPFFPASLKALQMVYYARRILQKFIIYIYICVVSYFFSDMTITTICAGVKRRLLLAFGDEDTRAVRGPICSIHFFSSCFLSCLLSCFLS